MFAGTSSSAGTGVQWHKFLGQKVRGIRIPTKRLYTTRPASGAAVVALTRVSPVSHSLVCMAVARSVIVGLKRRRLEGLGDV